MVRKRHRYVVVDVQKEDGWKSGTFTRSALLTEALSTSIKNIYGIQGLALAKTALRIEFLGPDANLARITMRRSAYKIVTSAFQLISVIDGGKCNVRSLHTAATIRHSNLFAERYLRQQIEQQLASASSEADRANLKLLITDKISSKRKSVGVSKEKVQNLGVSLAKKRKSIARLSKLLNE